MYKLYEFIRSIYVVVLFVIAESIAISHYALSDSYTHAKIFVVSNSIIGGVNGFFRNAIRLFELPGENRELTERIAQLEAQLDLSSENTLAYPSSAQIHFNNPEYSYIVAKVVSNSINKRDNLIMLDRGYEDGVYENMAVITPTGEMLGYVAGATAHYSAALSILSSSFTTSGKLSGGTHFGSLEWSGESRYHISMQELSKYAQINQGDTVVTTGFSKIFPGGVTIGTVDSFELDEMGTSYNIDISLAADISSIDYVLVVGSRESGEIEALQQEVEAKL
ncbi:MAG: rod shape-determining protein MreC [Rikenellaceae bacterium]